MFRIKMNLFYSTVILATFSSLQCASLQNKDVLIRSDGLVVKNKANEMTDTLDVLTKISDDFEQNYRSVSAVTDFSKVVVGMMDSLKDLELKGDEMMKKIDVQESQLKSLNQEIEAKEEYINVVNNKVKESEAIFNDLREKVKEIKSEKAASQEQTKRNENKIKAQETRLRRLVKDITTKVEYVNVVDNKIKEIETKVEGATKSLDMLEAEKKKIEARMLEYEKRGTFAKQQIVTLNSEILEKERSQRSRAVEAEKYSEEIERLKGEYVIFQEKVEIANNTLSNLEKATKELEPEEDLIDPKILYPAFAVSMIANLLMGGHILSQVPSTLSQSLNLGPISPSTTTSIKEKITEAAEKYEDDVNDLNEDISELYPGYDNYIGYDNYEAGYNPLLQLENIKKEREEILGKKNDYDFKRRSNFPELAYSY